MTLFLVSWECGGCGSRPYGSVRREGVHCSLAEISAGDHPTSWSFRAATLFLATFPPIQSTAINNEIMERTLLLPTDPIEPAVGE